MRNTNTPIRHVTHLNLALTGPELRTAVEGWSCEPPAKRRAVASRPLNSGPEAMRDEAVAALLAGGRRGDPFRSSDYRADPFPEL